MRFLVLFAVLGLLAGCDEEQRLYSYKEAPSPPSAPATAPMGAAPMPAGHPPITGNVADTSFALPEAQLPPADRVRLREDVPVRTVVVRDVAFTVPQEWTETPVASSMRAFQLSLPADGAGRSDGEVVFFHFGPPPAGGSADENIVRWVGQVEPASAPIVYRHEHDGMTISEVVVEGTLKPSGMGTGPSEPRPDSSLYGLIVEGGPQGALFIKATGSRSAIDAAKPALATMAGSATPVLDGTAP